MFKKFKVFLEMIKIEHTLFALPFAFMGAILGSYVINGHLPLWSQIGWILLAMIGARTAAMSLNRLIDQVFDGKNPRTMMRAIPAGLLRSSEVVLFTLISLVIFFWAVTQLDPLALKLLPIAIFMLVIYSYTKRFTWLCHVILGMTLGLAPLGGWIAITGHFSWTAIVFYIAVTFWTAGFDVIYACADEEFDREEGLYSIPSRFGIARALKIAQGFHVITAVGLIAIGIMAGLGWWYFAGAVIALAILFYQHYILTPKDLSRLQTSFFTLNSTLSLIVFVFTLIDLVVKQWW